MSRTKCRISTGLLCLLTAACVFGADNVHNVRDYGARPDGKTLCTKSIQKAIDECAERGGGTVYLPPGRWLTGTVYLADNVSIELENGCTILGTTDKSQYGPPRQLLGAEGEQYSTWAIFAGKGLRSIAIRGRGTIDGQGSHFKYKNGARPKNLYFEDCQDVLIEGVRLRSAGSWMQHYRDCDRLTIRDIAVFNHVSYNNDGLNIDSCRDVTIVGCMIDSDDAIVLKSLSTKPTENVTISDCVISSHCNAIKMGTESGGGSREDAKREIPEKPDSYPESTMFGTLPAYGFFCRHARDLRLHNVRVHTSTPDLRHAIVLDDVEDALIDSLDATFSAGASSMVRLTNVKGAFIRGCRPRTGTDTFLKLEGEASEGVVLVANDLSRVRRVVEMTSDVPKAALAKIANHVEQKSRKD